MQRNAWINTISTLVFSAFCALLRWLQNINVFEEETGLVKAGSALNYLVALVAIGAAVALWVLCRPLERYSAPTEPEEAFADAPRGLMAVLVAAALAAAVGSVFFFFTGSSLLLRVTALLSLLSVPALMLYPYLPRWGALGAVLSLAPVLSFSVYLVAAYREYAGNPVVWSYAPLILAAAAVLYGAFQMSAYLFYRPRPVMAIYSGCLAPVFALGILMDTAAGAARLVLGAWSVGLLALSGLLILNLSEKSAADDRDMDEDYE